jgi:hypothetical protein
MKIQQLRSFYKILLKFTNMATFRNTVLVSDHFKMMCKYSSGNFGENFI